MAERTLFLAWHGAKENRLWFPVGRLDADVAAANYRFRYTGGAKRAQREAGYPLLVEFPDLQREYQSPDLSTTCFRIALCPRSGRISRAIWKPLPWTGIADPIEILAANGGERVTDRYEVFPKPGRQEDGSFAYRFFLHGWRYASASAQERMSCLKPGENLVVSLELNNPVVGRGVQIQTADYQMIGWAPHYLVEDICNAVISASSRYAARVVRLNPQPAPSKQRLLVELRIYWKRREPMTGKDFQPLVG